MTGIKRAQVAAEDFVKEVNTPKPQKTFTPLMTVSTGSTLLDLAIYGDRIRGGGCPGGTVLEIYSEYGLGKTAIASEMCGNAQAKGGDIRFRDPEGRLDQEYAELYGMHLPEDKYKKTHYALEIFDDFRAWNPPKDKVNVFVCDSLAALTTELEMTKGDKMGMKRAKEIGEGIRKSSVLLSEGNRIMVLTNQLRTGEKGKFTPGGAAPGFWSSIIVELRRISQYTKGIINKSPTITKTLKVGDKKREIEKTIGIRTMAFVVKNSKDDPFRQAPISIVFKYGIDDVRENLQYIKDIMGNTTFECPDGKSSVSLEDAIVHVEENNLESDLRESVINIWEEVEELFRDVSKRKNKKR